jgi:GTP cyclohydrolase I
MTTRTKIILRSGKDQSPKRFHPWVFSGAIKKIKGSAREGALVDLYDNKDEYLATGHYADGSIAVRVLGFEQGAYGQDFWEERVAKAWQEITSGYDQDPGSMVRSALFEAEGQEMIIVNDIDFYSVCEHHMLPFFGKAHVAYIPDGNIVGLSKIPRVVDVFARRLQVQERLTDDIVECINQTLKPRGVAVVIEAAHMCMMMRGVQKQNSVTTTSGFRGQFEKSETRNEFLKLIGSDLS